MFPSSRTVSEEWEGFVVSLWVSSLRILFGTLEYYGMLLIMKTDNSHWVSLFCTSEMLSTFRGAVECENELRKYSLVSARIAITSDQNLEQAFFSERLLMTQKKESSVSLFFSIRSVYLRWGG